MELNTIIHIIHSVVLIIYSFVCVLYIHEQITNYRD